MDGTDVQMLFTTLTPTDGIEKKSLVATTDNIVCQIKEMLLLVKCNHVNLSIKTPTFWFHLLQLVFL